MQGGADLNVQHVYTNVLDTRFAPWLCSRIVPHIPAAVTPNQITWFGCVAGSVSGIGFYLASFNHGWFILALVGSALFWLADTLDGTLA